MRKLILLCLALTLCTYAFAHDAVVHHIYFNLNHEDQTASVTYAPSHKSYTGEIDIPETIKVKGVKYTVTCIGDSAFFNCNDIDWIIIPKTIKRIGKSAFEGCNRKRGGDDAVRGLPPSVIVEDRAFANSSVISTKYAFNCGTKYIGREAFKNARINVFHADKDLKGIAAGAFEGCIGLRGVGFPDLRKWCEVEMEDLSANPITTSHNIEIPIFNEQFNTSLYELQKDLIIPDGPIKINPYVFAGANIKSLVLANTVKSVGEKAFYQCKQLEQLCIPATVERIEDDAFAGCEALQIIILANPDIKVGANNFSNFRGRLIVGTGMTEKIRQNHLWDKANIYESDDIERYISSRQEEYFIVDE